MILKKNFNPLAVVRYLRTELLLSSLLSVGAYLLYEAAVPGLPVVPFSVTAIMGSALAIFLAFRNNNAYGRWWEARTLWGGIVNNSRIFARQIIANVDHAVRTGKVASDKANAFTKELLYRQIAFANALRIQLRGEEAFNSLRSLLPEEEYREVLGCQNKANYLLLRQGIRIKEGIREELLGAFDNISLEPTLAGFNNFQGGCERIKNTPLLRQYHFFTRLFLLAFMLLLPFSLIGDFSRMGHSWLMIPVSLLIAFVFGVMGKVGEVNEDPFENRITDVPLSALCNTVERDLREMMGEQELPAKQVPAAGFLH